ncbi:patatin-like phospholipase family protein [Microbacterium sp. NPDC019599]|uniref:patatin-like phospholipase family protein n=1 Tax=Microbacterium sp. NPDC019599 TaxID=3154690 RepID=UPI0033DB2921
MTERSPSPLSGPRERALVLGGGGSAGNAWLIGVVAGLFEAGLDVTDADLIVGTSAGSTAAAQITGAAPSALLAEILAAPPAPGRGPARPALTMSHLQRLDATIAASTDAADYRRRMSAVLLADPAPDRSAQWRATVAARFAGRGWPSDSLLITAVDAKTAEPVLFDRDSGVDIVDAVAASCAGGFAYRIGEGRYIDGGYRTNPDNADLAQGWAKVLVLSPLGGASRTPAAWGLHLADQVEALRAGGSRVETVFPDDTSREAFGDNLMDPSTRLPAAKAGYDQGRALLARVAEFWLG